MSREGSYKDPSHFIPLLYITISFCTLFKCEPHIREQFIFSGRWIQAALRKSAFQAPLGLQEHCICSQMSRKWQPSFLRSTQVLPNGHKRFYKWKQFQNRVALSIVLRFWLTLRSSTSFSKCPIFIIIDFHHSHQYKPGSVLFLEVTSSR